MAEDATIPNINEFLQTRKADILNRLLEGVETGADLTDLTTLRQYLATIPEFDDEGAQRRWWEDNIDTDLRTEPEDLQKDDVDHIRAVLSDIITASGSTDQTETAAHLYLLSIDRNFELPNDKTAVAFLQENPIISLKGDLRWLTAPRANNHPSIFGQDFELYNIDADNLTNPSSDDFIETLGAALTAVQTDMRNLGISPPVGPDAFLDPMKVANPEESQYHNNVVNAIITKLGDADNEDLQEIRELEGTDRLDALTQYVNDLDNSTPDKAEILEDLETLRSTDTPMQFIELAIEYDVLPESAIQRAILFNIHNIGADKTGMFGDNTEALLETYLDYAKNSQQFEATHAAQRVRADYLGRIYEAYLQLPEDQRNAIDAALANKAGDAPGVQRPVPPEEEAERAAREAEREALRGQYDVLGAAATVMNIPSEIMTELNPRVLSGVTYAHFDEGFERQMRDIFSENWIDTYGIKRPTSDDPSERIGGDENLWRYRYPEPVCADFINTYFETHNSNLIVQNIIGQTEDPFERYELIKSAVSGLDEDDPLAIGFAALERDVNANSLEYHIHPATGEIDTYRVAANGVDLYTNAGPGNPLPLVLEGQKPDFDIFHPNFVTRDLLNTMTEDMWNKMAPDNGRGLGQIFTRQPSVNDLEQGIHIIETKAKEAIQSLDPEMDEDTINELFNDVQQALENPEQYYRAKLARENPNLEEEELESRLESLMATHDATSTMSEILRAREGSRNTVEQIHTHLVQIQSMRELQDITAMRDYANLMVDGLLPDGSTVTPPRTEAPWGQDFSGMYREGAFRWEACTEFNTLTPELYAAYDRALNSGGSVNTSLFAHNDYAVAYIEAQGWEGDLDYIQSSMVARAMMIKEAADRHNVDPNSPEARAAFLEDYHSGYYNKIDIEIMMRSFDADGQGRAAERAQFEKHAYSPGSFDQAADIDHRMRAFAEMFAQPVSIPTADGSEIIANSTITIEDAMLLFWRNDGKQGNLIDPHTGEVYDEEKYGLDYETMLERHPEEFPEIIQGIMENSNYYQINLLRDVNNPLGDFHSREVRRFQETYQQQLEVQYKEENNVVSAAPEVNVNATPELDAASDTIVPMPEPQEEEQAPANDARAELCENSNDLTCVTPAVAAATGSGAPPQPDIHPDLQGP